MRSFAIAVLVAGCAAQPPPARVTAAVPAAPPSALVQLETSRDLDDVVVGKSDAPATVIMLLASWCTHCRDELRVFDAVRARHPRVRWLGLNYKEHEEYDGRGNAVSIRALAHELPWLRIVPAGEELFTAIGRPPLVPTVLVYDRSGTLVARFDRRERKPPREAELDALLRSLP